MIKAAIFDLDGTLANTLETIAYFANQALNSHSLNSIAVEEYRYMVGDGAKNLVLRMLEKVSADKSFFDKVYPLYNSSYDNNFLYNTKPYDGILDMLKDLSDMGIKIGVVSNKPDETTVKIVTSLFSPYISLAIGQRDDIPKKPDPTAVIGLLNEWNISREDAVYVGDTKTDMETGKNAELFTIGVLWGFRDYDELIKNGADLIVKHPHEITSYIKMQIKN